MEQGVDEEEVALPAGRWSAAAESPRTGEQWLLRALINEKLAQVKEGTSAGRTQEWAQWGGHAKCRLGGVAGAPQEHMGRTQQQPSAGVAAGVQVVRAGQALRRGRRFEAWRGLGEGTLGPTGRRETLGQQRASGSAASFPHFAVACL